MAQASKAAEQAGKATEESAKRADTSMGRMVQSVQKNQQAWTTAGATLTGFGAATLGALGLATKAAMDWESAWAGVQKTVDGTAPQMEALEAGLRGMARELPSSHAEIAAVAEAAGQLGIETPNILAFTRTMIDLGESTNMSAEEAAMSLSRFMNVMQTSQADVGRLGAAVVGLGNNFETTESEIVSMAQRLSGASAQAGLTEGEVLGLATAMSSVGIEAEAGGSAMSLSMKRIGKAVDEGGSKLDLFAQVSGMSSEQFAQAWETRPAEALTAFVDGLSRTEQLGMSTNAVLSELGITGIREADAMLRLSSATGTLGDAMAMGNVEFEKGTALIEEASKRYETAESRVAMARNALVDAGISIGSVVLPAFAGLADSVADVAGWFADLPAPVHGVLTSLAGVAGVSATAAGSFLLLFPRVMDTVQAFKQLRADGVAGSIGKVGRAAGLAATAFIGLQVAGAVVESFAEARITADELTASLMNAAVTSEVTAASLDEMIAATGTGNASVRDLGNALEILDAGGFAKFIDQVNAGFGVWDTQTEIAAEQVAKLDQALTTMAQSGAADVMSDSFNAALESVEAYGYSAEDLIASLPGLEAELTRTATALGLNADSATLVKLATGELSPVLDEATGAVVGFADGMDDAGQSATDAADATEEYYKALRDLANEFITAERAALDYAESMEETAKAAKENGKHWEDGTEAADENKRALLDLAEQALATADSLAPKGESGTFLKEAREDLIAVATEMTGSKELAEEYVDQLLGTPEDIETIISLETEQALADWAALWDEIGYHPPEVPVGADTDPAKESVTEFEGTVMNGTPPEVPVGADTSGAKEEVDGFGAGVGDTPTTPLDITSNIQPAMAEVLDLEDAINASGGTVEINGNSVPGDQVLDTLMGVINSSDGTVTIDGQSHPAEEALAAAIRAINNGEGTVEIDGDNSGANSATNSAVSHANRSSGSIKVDASTGSAERAINHAARPRRTTITVGYSDPGFKGSGGGSRFAAGGPVYGPGTGTSDSIPALLSNGEHVITAREVALAGGQDAIYRMREAIRSGFRFANGGAVERGAQAAPSWRAPNVVMRPSSSDGPSVGAQVAAAISSWQPVVNIDGREFAGLMMQGNSRIHAMGGRR